MVGAFVAAVVLLISFVLWERRIDHPILDVRFFKNPRFTAASIAITLVFFAMFGSMFFVSQYLQFVLGYSALKSGVRLIPIAGALDDRGADVGRPGAARSAPSASSPPACVLVAVALLLFSRVTTTSGYGARRRRARDRRRRHGPRDGTGHRLDHGLAAAATRPASARR